MKYTNEEHTQATHNGSSGRVEDLLRLGYVTQEDIDSAEDYFFDEEKELIEKATAQVQSMLDTEAQSRGYDDMNSIGKYLGYDNLFRAECEALGAWTSACWAKCYELQSGGVMPSDLLAEMPQLEV